MEPFGSDALRGAGLLYFCARDSDDIYVLPSLPRSRPRFGSVGPDITE